MGQSIGGMTRSRRAFGLAIAFVGAACGGAPPPPAAPPKPPPAAAVAAAPDVSEVPEPKHLVGIVRWKNPDATLQTIFQWTGIRLNAADLASEGLDKNLASTLAWDAPIDAAIALDEKGDDAFTPLAAVAVGVRSIDAARTAAQGFGTVTEVAPGEYKVTLRHKKKKGDKPFCLLAAAAGPTPGRFVCGERERDVQSLRAYLTRTMPRRDLGPSDLHVELRVPPVVDMYGPTIQQALHMAAALAPRKLQIGEPAFDRAIDRLATGLSDEVGAFLQDADTLSFDLAMAPEKATMSGAVHLKGQQSWTTGTLASEASRVGPPPQMFWRLPATATSAFYSYLPESKRFEPIRRTLADLADGWLQHEGIALADRTAITTLFDDKLAIDAPWVSATGSFAPDAAKPPAKGKAPAPSDAIQAALDAYGWSVVGVGAPNATSDIVKALSAAVSRPKIQAYIKSKLASLSSGDDTTKPKVSAVSLKPAPAPKELPKGSLAFELAVTGQSAAPAPSETDRQLSKSAPAAAKKPAPFTAKLHVLVVPESAQTWIAFGSDKAQLAKIVLASTEGAPSAATLASRTDLEPMQKAKLAGSGFSTLEALLRSWSAPWGTDNAFAPKAQNAMSALGSTPNKGKSPIMSFDDVKTGDGTTWTLRIDVPKGVIEDAIILAASSGLASLPGR